MSGTAMKTLWWKGLLLASHQLADFLPSLNNMTHESSHKVVFVVVSWVDVIKSHFHLAVLQENHSSQMNKEIN